MAVRKSLFRLAILILILPVGIVLFLHTFGENKMEIPVLSSLDDCDIKSGTHLILSGVVSTNSQKNQLARINKRISTKQVDFRAAEAECFSDTLALLLVDQQADLRGTYQLEHNDINRFFAELDILLMTENYGKGVSR